MLVEEIAQQVRSHYLALYRQEIAEYRAQFNPAAPELLLELSRDCPEPYRLYRIDLVGGASSEPDLTEVNPGVHLEFEPVEEDYLGITVSTFPFVWNGVEFDIRPPIADDTELAAWVKKWIDVSDSAKMDDDGLGNYIHSVTQPETSDGTTQFSVDFGSSQLDSLKELFSVLHAAGADEVTIHSRSYFGSE